VASNSCVVVVVVLVVVLDSEPLLSGDGAGGILGLGNEALGTVPGESKLLLVLFVRPPLLAPEWSTEFTWDLSAKKYKICDLST
jgi:hypothetical protein